MQGSVLFSRLKMEDFTPCLVVLTESELLWKHGISISVGEVNRLDLREIVCVISVDQLCRENLPVKMYKLLRKKLTQIQSISGTGFVVSSIARSGRHKWRTREQIFWCDSADDTSRWISALNKRIKLANPARPQRLLIFINPKSGYKKADHFYENILEPLFHLANVDADLFVTKYRGHLTEYLLTRPLGTYDGILCVGGDGFFAEAAQGLLLRERLKANLPLFRGHLPDSPQITSSIRVGIIPAGSTDTVVYSTHGTNDVLTAALHIIIGDDLAMDVAAIHSEVDGSFLRYTISMLGYGFHADLLRNDDKLRWMGPRRYDYSGFHTFLAHAVYQGELTYLPSADRDSHVQDGVLCTSGCLVCSTDRISVFDSTSGTDSGLEISEDGSGGVTLIRDCRTRKQHTVSPAVPVITPVYCEVSEKTRNMFADSNNDVSARNDNTLQVPVQRDRPHSFPSTGSQPERETSQEQAGDPVRPKARRVIRSSVTAPAILLSPSWSVQGCPKGWKTVRGAFVAINAFLLSCRCARAPNGPSPWAHLGDGCIDLVLIKECSRARFLQFLMRTAGACHKPKDSNGGGGSSPFELSFVTVERVCAFKFRQYGSQLTAENCPLETNAPLSAGIELSSSPWSRTIDEPRQVSQADISNNHTKRSMWCADGELVHHENVGVYVHRRLLRIFARGPEPLDEDRSSAELTKRLTDCNELFDAIVSHAPSCSKSVFSVPVPKRFVQSTSNTIMVSTRP